MTVQNTLQEKLFKIYKIKGKKNSKWITGLTSQVIKAMKLLEVYALVADSLGKIGPTSTVVLRKQCFYLSTLPTSTIWGNVWSSPKLRKSALNMHPTCKLISHQPQKAAVKLQLNPTSWWGNWFPQPKQLSFTKVIRVWLQTPHMSSRI